jgi:hypothetical protein
LSALAIGGIVFVCVFGGALFGMLLGAILPREYLSPEARDVVRVAMAMVATLAALVLGLLTASAKSSLDDKESALRSVAGQVVLLDRTMAQYGPDAKDARELLKETLMARISQIWPEESASVTAGAIGRGAGVEAVQQKLLALSPQNDAQRWLQSTALRISGDIASARWSAFAKLGSSIKWPFLVVVVFWLAVIFASFGLFAPRNISVAAALFLASLSVAGSIYLILGMDQPYDGLITLSSAPLRIALGQLGQP